jgi:class 3 adenylate cyclase
MSDLKYQTFDELLHAAHDNPAAADEITRRYSSKAAILVVDFTDMVRRTDAYDIVYALSLARAAERAFEPAVRIHNGEMVKSVADSFFAVFSAPRDALAAAINGHKRMAYFNQARTGTLADGSRNDAIHPCTGLGFGDTLIIPGEDVYGAEVNRAFVLGEDVANKNEILSTRAFMASFSTPLNTVIAHPANSERQAVSRFPFFVLEVQAARG